MIQRHNEKLPVCSYCLEPGHTAFKCGKKPNKTLNTYNGLKVSSSFGGKRKPMKPTKMECKTCGSNRHTNMQCPANRKPLSTNGKQKAAWYKTKVAWMKANEQDYYTCHYCRKTMPQNETTLDHMESRGRRPDLRHDMSNLVPCCWNCNGLKGSKSHDEIPHTCV